MYNKNTDARTAKRVCITVHGMRSRNNKGHTIFVSALTWAGAATKEVTIAVPATNRTKQKWVWMNEISDPTLHTYLSWSKPSVPQKPLKPKAMWWHVAGFRYAKKGIFKRSTDSSPGPSVFPLLVHSKPLVPFKRYNKRSKRNRRNLCQKLYEIFIIFMIWLDVDRIRSYDLPPRSHRQSV